MARKGDQQRMTIWKWNKASAQQTNDMIKKAPPGSPFGKPNMAVYSIYEWLARRKKTPRRAGDGFEPTSGPSGHGMPYPEGARASHPRFLFSEGGRARLRGYEGARWVIQTHPSVGAHCMRPWRCRCPGRHCVQRGRMQCAPTGRRAVDSSGQAVPLGNEGVPPLLVSFSRGRARGRDTLSRGDPLRTGN